MFVSKGVSDGAGAVIIASEDAVKKHNFTPLARIVGYFVSGCDPTIMGIGKFIDECECGGARGPRGGNPGLQRESGPRLGLRGGSKNRDARRGLKDLFW